MPASENSRRNMQETVLENPSIPDHDRTKDPGMHSAHPETHEPEQSEHGALDESEIAAPDQEFGQILASGPGANQGRIPEDPNNWLTSDREKNYSDGDPENRGDSLPDMMEENPN